MRKTLLWGSLVATSLAAAPVFADEQPATAIGGPGESCRARADCKSGLKCVNQTCADEHEGQSCSATGDCGGELKCIKNKCTSGTAVASSSAASSSSGDSPQRSMGLEGVHPFVGLTWAQGPVVPGLSGNARGGFNRADSAFMFALHGGVFIDKHQLLVEISPFTYGFDARGLGPAFQMNGNYAYFIPLMESEAVSLYWPLRVGVGMVAGGDNTTGLVSFQARGDIVGLAAKVGHFMFDFHVPSFRYIVTDSRGTQGHLPTWLIGMSTSYVF
jgi:hypothetical protein